MNKTLYFEGAGMDFINKDGDNWNYRIRTYFKFNDKNYYLELGQAGQRLNNGLQILDFFIRDESKKHQDYYNIPMSNKIDMAKTLPFNKEGIKTFLKDAIGYIVDDVIVLDYFEKYRVFGDNDVYNFMDDHIVNPERTEKRKKAFNILDKYYRYNTGNKYSVISILELFDDTLTIRCHTYEKLLQSAGLPRVQTVNINEDLQSFIN